MAAGALLAGVLLLMQGVDSIRTDHCLNRWYPDVPGYTFNVSVDCLESGLNITWQKQSGGDYHAEVNYVCTNSYRNIVAENPERIIFETSVNGSLQTNASIIQDIISSGGDCTVYGCHEIAGGLRIRGTFYNNNQSCSYTGSGDSAATEVWTSSKISPTSTDTPMNPTRTSFELPLNSSAIVVHSAITSRYSSAIIPSTTSAVIMKRISHSNDDNLTILATLQPTIIAPPRKGFNATAITIPVVVFSALLISAILLVGILITCSKKKIIEHPRFKNKMTFDMESEKIDPYYAPIQVEPYVTKCESMSSVLEHLSPTVNEMMKFTLPFHISKNEAHKAITNSSYILQPPPLSRTDSSDSSDSSSNYQFSNTSIASTPLNVAPTNIELGTGRSLQSVLLANEHRTTACSSLLFEQKQCCAYASSDVESLSSQSAASSQGTETCLRRPSSYDLDKLILSKPDECSSAEESFQDHHIVLTFSSTLSCNDDVIFIEQESNNSDTHSEDCIPEGIQGHRLTKTNLTINPHHFDPI